MVEGVGRFCFEFLARLKASRLSSFPISKIGALVSSGLCAALALDYLF